MVYCEDTDELFECSEEANKLSEKIQRAHDRRDAREYFELCSDSGVCPKDVELYTNGERLYNEQRKMDSEIEKIVDDYADEKLERIARVALVRFTELQRRENITSAEIIRRLSAIRDAGYNVPSYSKLKKEKKWQLLMGIRKGLWKKLEKTNPELAKEIRSQNQKQKLDNYLIR